MKEKKSKNRISKKIKIFNEITPIQFSCIAAACPSIFETDRETFIFVGKKLKGKDISENIKHKIGNDETVIEVPKKLITDLFKT